MTPDDHEDLAAEAFITQKRGPDASYQFNASEFSFNGRSGSASSNDGYVTISLGNASKSGNGTNAYLTMGYRQGLGSRNRGSIVVTPSAGFKITSIKVTYSSSDDRGYDFGNTSVTVYPGTYTRDSDNNRTATWTGSSTGAVTFTNGYQRNTIGTDFPNITSIVVEYEPVNN